MYYLNVLSEDWKALWLADMKQSRKNKTLYSPSDELECLYNILYFLHTTKSTFEVKECIMIYILSVLKQLKNKFHTHVLSHVYTFNLVCLWYNLTCWSLFKSEAELLKLENYVNFLLSCNNFA